jgi:hypothetical protein
VEVETVVEVGPAGVMVDEVVDLRKSFLRWGNHNHGVHEEVGDHRGQRQEVDQSHQDEAIHMVAIEGIGPRGVEEGGALAEVLVVYRQILPVFMCLLVHQVNH